MSDTTPVKPENIEVLSPVATWQPFPVEALPEPVHSFVVAGGKALGTGVAYLAASILVVLAAAIGNAAVIRLKRTWTEPAVLWLGLVGESGTLKSPTLDLVPQPIWLDRFWWRWYFAFRGNNLAGERTWARKPSTWFGYRTRNEVNWRISWREDGWRRRLVSGRRCYYVPIRGKKVLRRGRSNCGFGGHQLIDGPPSSATIRRRRFGGIVVPQTGHKSAIPQTGWCTRGPFGGFGLFVTASRPGVLDDATAGRQTGGTGDYRVHRARGRSHHAEKNVLQPWRKEQWVLPPEQNADFVCAMEDVLEVYQRPYDPQRPAEWNDRRPTRRTRPASPLPRESRDLASQDRCTRPARRPQHTFDSMPLVSSQALDTIGGDKADAFLHTH